MVDMGVIRCCGEHDMGLAHLYNISTFELHTDRARGGCWNARVDFLAAVLPHSFAPLKRTDLARSWLISSSLSHHISHLLFIFVLRVNPISRRKLADLEAN